MPQYELKSLQRKHIETSSSILRKIGESYSNNTIIIVENDSEMFNKTVRKRKFLKTFSGSCQEAFYDFCETSSIPGFRYIGDKSRRYWDRGLWICFLLGSLYASYILIFNVWIKWQQSPVIVSFNERYTPIWHIPFPAITICPETKSRTNILNFTYSYSNLYRTVKEIGYFNRSENMSLDEFNYLQAVLQVCESYLMDEFTFSNTYHAVEVIDLLEKLSPLYNETYPFCKWRNTVTTCERYFSRTITEEGICYTFNGLDTSELYENITVQHNMTVEPRERTYSQWTLEQGYSAIMSNATYPQRVLTAGTRGGFFIALQGFDYNLDYFCRGPIQGFKVLLHSPDDVPQVSKHYIRVPFDQEVIVSVKPNMITTSEELKNYEPHKRQCFFSHEKKLKFFKVYTQSNCHLECLTNFTLQKCGCVKFSMPRTPETPICDISNIACYNDAEDDLLRLNYEEGLESIDGAICDCLPACTSLTYNTEISQAYFNLESLIRAYNSSYLEDNPGVRMSRLSLFFKENQFITSKRSELYGLTDFIANCGGLLGLCTGVSVLSIFEIIYFSTVRVVTFYIIRRENKR